MALAALPFALRSVPSSRRRSAGFTLLELMVVVAIIGITAAIAAPAIVRAMAMSRADRANHDLIRVIRFARSQSMAYGRTYLVRMISTGVTRVEFWQGTTSACRLENWTTIVATGSCLSMNPGNCIDMVDANAYTVAIHSVQFDDGGQDLCFQPNGDMFTRPSGGAGLFAIPATGVVQFTTTRLMNGADAGDPRRGVVIPVGGAPRALR